MDGKKLKLIKKLREITGMSVNKCRIAIDESNGNIDLAIKNLYGKIKRFEDKTVFLNEGIVIAKLSEKKNIGVILELNCETDFSAKNNQFQDLGEEIALFALNSNQINKNFLNEKFKEKILILRSKLGENININKIKKIKGEKLEFYLHRKKIGVIVSSDKYAKEDLLKKIAMHIAASNPKYIDIKDIPLKVINEKKEEYLKIAQQYNKDKIIINKIVEGKIRKFSENISLLYQKSIFNNKENIKQFLKRENFKIYNFINIKLGF